MGPLREKTVKVNADIANTISAARQAINQCGWKVASMDASTIKASTGVSIWSWGETVVVQVQTSGGVTYLNVQSKSGWALVDWGKNQENVNKFLTHLSRLLQIA